MTKQNKSVSAREHNKGKILLAASKEFILQGFKGATVQSIADRAGLPKANVLYYFKSKDNLYQAVLDNTLQLWDEGIGEVTLSDGPKVAIQKMIEAKVRLSFQFPDASKIYAMEIIQGAPHLKEHARTYQRNWVRDKAAMFQHWIDEKRMLAVDPTYLIFLIWASTQHYADFETQILTIMNRAEYEESDVINITRFLSEVILRGCGLEAIDN